MHKETQQALRQQMPKPTMKDIEDLTVDERDESFAYMEKVIKNYNQIKILNDENFINKHIYENTNTKKIYIKKIYLFFSKKFALQPRIAHKYAPYPPINHQKYPSSL